LPFLCLIVDHLECPDIYVSSLIQNLIVNLNSIR